MMASGRLTRLGGLLRLNSVLFGASRADLSTSSKCLASFVLKDANRKQSLILNKSQVRFLAETGHSQSQTQADSGQSEAHEEAESGDETIEDMILKRAMKYVPEVGFTTEAISRGNLKSCFF